MPANAKKVTASVAFTDARFMSAKDKALVATQWERFLRALSRSLDEPVQPMEHADYGRYPTALDKAFTGRLYDHLIQHCSFIAHYNSLGFLGHYFTNPADTLVFLSQFDGRGKLDSVEYGLDWIRGEYEDVNEAMVEIATPMIDGLVTQLKALVRKQELAMATALAARHGFTVQAPAAPAPDEYTGPPVEPMRCMYCHVPEDEARGTVCLPGCHHSFVTRRPGQSSSEAEEAALLCGTITMSPRQMAEAQARLEGK